MVFQFPNRSGVSRHGDHEYHYFVLSQDDATPVLDDLEGPARGRRPQGRNQDEFPPRGIKIGGVGTDKPGVR